MTVTITSNQLYPWGTQAWLANIVLNEPSASFQFELISSSYTPKTDHQYFRSGSDTDLPWNHTLTYSSKNTPISASFALLAQTASVPGGSYIIDPRVGGESAATFTGVDAGQEVAGVIMYLQNGAEPQPCTCDPDVGAGGTSNCYNWAIWLKDKDDNPINIVADGGDISFTFNMTDIANPWPGGAPDFAANIYNNPNYYGAIVGMLGNCE